MAVDEGFQATCQDFINEGVADNTFFRSAKLQLLANLAGENGKPTNLEIGRPSGQIIFAGTHLTPAKRMALAGYNSVKPSFSIVTTTMATNVVIQGARDVAPQLTNANISGNSQGSMRATAEVKWTGVIKEEIVIWKTELDRTVREAGASKTGRGVARSRLILDATNRAKQNVLTRLNTELQSGAPTDQTADPMDHLLGFATWFSATNVCANVDRGIPRNATWRSIVDATARAPIVSKLLDVANITNHLLDLSEDGTVALLVNDACWPVMRDECLGKGFVQVANSMPGMAAYGAKNLFALQKDGCYIVRDTSVPASTAYAIVPNTWAFITEPDHTFSVTPFQDESRSVRGGSECLFAHVELQAMLVCWNPGLNMVFTNITDPS